MRRRSNSGCSTPSIRNSNGAELEKCWPLKRFPVLLDGERLVAEASSIVEYVDQRAPNGPRLIPMDTGSPGALSSAARPSRSIRLLLACEPLCTALETG
jgi:hypothetical protein